MSRSALTGLPTRATCTASWMPRSPIDVVLDQIKKQEKKVAEMQQELDAEKTMLDKLLQAKKMLEST